MKLALICVVLLVITFGWGVLMSLAFPEPWSLIFSAVGGWIFGWYVIGPILISLIFGDK